MCGDCYIAEISLDPKEFLEKRRLNCGFEDEEYGEAKMLSRRYRLITSRELVSSGNFKILFYHR